MDLSIMLEDEKMGWQRYASPVHPKFFLRLSAVLLAGAFILFASLLV
jgi:hypothetical protein